MLTALFGIGSVFVLMIMFGLLGLLMDKLAKREGQERVRHEVERMIDNDRRAG